MKTIILVIFILSFSLYSSQSGITLKDLNNKSHSIDNYIGKKIVLLNFWATWCGPCKKELPIINELHQKYKDKNFTVISISLDDPSEYSQVRSIAYGLGIKFPILLDPNSKAADYYNPSKSAPFSILYSSNGEKIKTFLGFTSSDKAELEELILHEVNRKELNKKNDFSWRFSTLGIYTRYFEDDLNQIFSNYEFLSTRTHLAAFYKKYSISSSFHTNNFLSTTKYIREKYSENTSDLRLEKISLIGYIGKQSYTLGDFHITQGKGIALSINKQDDLGLDNTLQGINLDLIYKKINLNLFSGFVNNTNIDFNNNELYDDKRDLISGASLTFDILNSLILSTNYNMIIFKEQSFDDVYIKPDNYKQHIIQIIGGNISYNLNTNLKFYLESDYLVDNFYNEDQKRDNSYAVYASIYFSYDKFVITQEFKRYKDFQIGFSSDVGNDKWYYANDSVFYNNPMTLEREGENIKDLAGNVWGARTNIKYKLTNNIKPYFNYLYTFSFAHEYYKDRRTHHIYIGNEYYFNDLKNKLDLSLSLRLEKYNEFDDNIKSNETDNYYGFEFDSTFYISSFLSLDFKGYYHFTKKSIQNENKIGDFVDSEITTTVTLFKDLFISYLYNRYTFSQEVGSKHNYNAFDIKYRFLADSYLRAFYGEIRPGLKCIGGVCKQYPAFNGLKIELLLSF